MGVARLPKGRWRSAGKGTSHAPAILPHKPLQRGVLVCAAFFHFEEFWIANIPGIDVDGFGLPDSIPCNARFKNL